VIVYLDASALVKRYVAEVGSTEVRHLISQADAVGSSLISRAEVAAALSKATRLEALTSEEASAALYVFRAQWADLIRVQPTETIAARADGLAWEHGLRGYDAMHLATALFWQDTLGEAVTLATFDRQLWRATQDIGMLPWPKDLNQFTNL
jgi:predicted nucleic acid-binding protein